MNDVEHGPVPKSNKVANYLYMKYVRGENRSASPEIKTFTIQDLMAELLISKTLASLMMNNKNQNYYFFEKLVLENL